MAGNVSEVTLRLKVIDDGSVILDKFAKKSKQAAQQSASAWNQLKSSWMGITAAIYSFKQVMDVYVEHERAVRLMNVTFKGAAGEMTQKAKEISRATENLFHTDEIMNSMARFASGMKRYGIEGEDYINMISRATEVAAARSMGLEETMQRLEAAMRGEAESAEYLGLTLNDTYMKTIAFNGALKEKWETMTDLEKSAYRYQEMMNQTAEYEGSAAEAAGSFEGQIKKVWNSIKDLLIPILRVLAPILAKIAEGWNLIINALSALVGGVLSQLFKGLSWVYAKMEKLPDWFPQAESIRNMAGVWKDMSDEWSKGMAEFGTTAAENLMTQVEGYTSGGGKKKKAPAALAPIVVPPAEADVEKALKEYKKYYNELIKMSAEAAKEIKKHHDEILRLEAARAENRQTTSEMIRGLQKMEMTEEERIISDIEALQVQHTLAMESEGQSRIDQLEKYKQGVASVAQTYHAWAEAQYGAGTASQVIADAMELIERAAEEQDATYEELIIKEHERAAAAQESAAVIQDTIKRLEYDIELLNQKASEPLVIRAQTADTMIKLQQIQTEIAKIQDKTITIRVKMEGQASPVKPLMETIRDVHNALGGLPASHSFKVDFGSMGMGIPSPLDIKTQIYNLEQQALQASAGPRAQWNIYQSKAYGPWIPPGDSGIHYTDLIRQQEAPYRRQIGELQELYKYSIKHYSQSASARGGSGGVTVDVGPININVAGVGPDRDLAITIADALDSEIAGKIQHNRSKIPGALGLN